MINNRFTDASFQAGLRNDFEAAKPFRYVVMDNFLDEAFALQLSQNFPAIGSMKTTYNGLNEKKAEHSELASLSKEFYQLKELLFSRPIIALVETITGLKNLQVIDDRFGYGLHQGGNDSFLDIHIDYNLHPIEKKHRRLNLLIFLNQEWEEGWGGMLQFWNADVTECVASILPKFNRCVLFECNAISHHGYNKIHCPENITRRSFYTYYFSEPAEKMIFHDTVFKPLPQDTVWKRMAVTCKEGAKNTIKRWLYKTGLLKVLK